MFIFQLPAMSGLRVLDMVTPPKQSVRAVPCPPNTPVRRRRRWRYARNRCPGFPSTRTAAAESPPPTTVNAPGDVVAAIASATPWCRRRTSRTRTRPTARSRRSSSPRQHGGEPLDRLWSDVQAHPTVGDGVGGHRLRLCVSSELVRDDDVGGRSDDVSEALEQVLADVDLILCSSEVPTLVALCRQERERHAAADYQGVDLGASASITPSLSDTLEPPSTTAYGRAGSCVRRDSTFTSAVTRSPA